MNRTTASVIATVLHYTGIFDIARLLTGRLPRIPVYHRFARGAKARALDAALFERHVWYLKSRFTLVTMRELALALRAGRDASRLAALTVDDGYRDCYLYAYPVLQHYQVPATVYVTPGFIDGQLWYWPDRIRYILDEAPGSRLLLSYAGLPAEYDLSTPAKRHYAWKVIADYCFWLTSVARESWLEKFASDLSVVVPSVSPEEYAPLSWAEVREMASAGVEIGSHTMTHPRLVQIGGSELADEVKMSKARIEEEIGRTVHSFCYPYGTWADVGPAARDAVERSGYISAVLAEARRAPQLDPFAIGRMNVDVTSMPHFLRLVSGIDALIPGRGGC